MKLFERIQKDMYASMKAGDKTKAGTLRVAIAGLKDKRIAKREDLSEDEQVKVIQTLVKQRRESIEMYNKGDRQDLVDREKKEISFLEVYLPAQMSTEDLKIMIAGIISETGASGMADIGKVMPIIMQKGAGKVDGKTAQALARELLQD